jgi:hypothetical protein
METPLGPRTLTPLPAANHAPAPKSKPDPRPMRVALGAGGLAALSALATGIVMPPSPVTQQPLTLQYATDNSAAPNPGGTITVQRQITYVQLLPGQTPPPGATVIPATAPKPITIVTTINAPKQAQSKQVAPKPIIIKTTASGKVVP